MKQVMVLEVWVDEKASDGKECAEEVVHEAQGHYYCLDGTVEIRVAETAYAKPKVEK